MTYIYDIILNFQKNYYQFFEWKPEDKILSIPKVSLYHISNRDILILKDNNVKVSQDFIKKIKNDNRNYKKIICIVSNGKIALALQFNSKGYIINRSSLIFEEEEEANNLVNNKDIIKIIYEKNTSQTNNNILRIEKERKEEIISFVKETKDITTLKYLYYECFEEDIEEITILKEKLLKELHKEWNGTKKKLYEIIDLLIKTN